MKETSIAGLKDTNECLSIEDQEITNSISSLNENVEVTTESNEKMNKESVTSDQSSYSSVNIEQNNIKSKTFFSQKKHCFKQIKLSPTNEIPTEYFLGCCSDIFSLFDNFGSSAFLPVKVDIYGNINKLKQKYSGDVKRYHTLQSIVRAEIQDQTTTVKNSATDALMWLKRAIWFLREFLYEFSNREKPDLSECVYISYQKSLRQYHNWVVRSIFTLALRSLPSTELFLQGLAIEPHIFLKDKKEFENQIKDEMKLIFYAIDNILKIINELYVREKLEK